MADKGYVVIYDMVSWTSGSIRDGDFAVHTLFRGDEVTSDVPAEKIKQWQDPETHPPHGAIAAQGTQLARLGASGVSVAMDPAEARRRYLDAAGEQTALRDPAGDPSDEEKTSVDPGVERSRTAPVRGTGTSQVAPAAASAGAANLDLESMNKSQLQTMADGLGVEYAKRESADDLREKIRTHMAGGSDDATGTGASENE